MTDIDTATRRLIATVRATDYDASGVAVRAADGEAEDIATDRAAYVPCDHEPGECPRDPWNAAPEDCDVYRADHAIVAAKRADDDALRLYRIWTGALAAHRSDTDDGATERAEQVAYDTLVDYVEAHDLNYSEFDPRTDTEGN